MSARRDNAWSERTPRPERLGLPDEGATRGLHLVTLALDPAVGPEVLVWIASDDPELGTIVGRGTFELVPRPFLLATEIGPLLQILWVVPDPADPTWPLWSFLTPVDPHGGDGHAVFQELAAQSRLHVVATALDGRVVAWVERDNPFSLALVEPYLARARELPAGALADALDQADALFEREEMLLYDEERSARGERLGDEGDLLSPSGEGRLALMARRAIAAGHHESLAAWGRDLAESFGEPTRDRTFAALARRLSQAEAELLFALWEVHDRLV